MWSTAHNASGLLYLFKKNKFTLFIQIFYATPAKNLSRFVTLLQLSNIYTVRQKKGKQLSFVCIFYYLTESDEFFEYIRPKESRSISYNSVYLILECVDNFAVTVTLNIFVFTRQVMKLMIVPSVL